MDIRIKNIIILTSVFFTVFFFALIPSSYAATITVDNGTSAIATDSSCSLREAIENANDDAATNSDCTAGSGTDTLNITTDIVLTSIDHLEGDETNYATPLVSESIIIVGNDHSITRSGGNDMQFLVLAGGDISLTISDLTISSFSLNAGTDRDGAIDLHDAGAGTLDITNVTFDSNEDGAIHSGMGGGSGNWTITDSTFSNNTTNGSGGAINSNSNRDVTISNSTFTNNVSTSGLDGSSLSYYGTSSGNILTIEDSTFTSNSFVGDVGCGAVGVSGLLGNTTIAVSGSVFDSNDAPYCGGALSIESGVAFASVTLNLTNNLFKNNSAASDSNKSGGAIYVQNNMTMNLTNNIFYGNSSVINGGAIHIYKDSSGIIAVNLSHNTFYGNSSEDGVGQDIYIETDAADTSVVENNIFASGGDECGGDLSSFTFTNNLANDSDCGSTAVTYIDTAPADNGGDIETIAILAGSNAINTAVAGSLDCPATDARGTARPSGSACDIGAYEYVNQAPTNISLSSSSIRENEGIGSVIGVLSTTDADVGSTHTYSLACTSPGADDASFSTSGSNLLTAENFNFEVKSTYSICIKTNDGYGGTYDKNFTITILDVDENIYGSSSGGSGGRRSTKIQEQEDVIEVINTPISELYEDENQQLEIIPDKPEPQIIEKQLYVQEEKSEDTLIKQEEKDKLDSNQNSVLIEENQVDKNKEKKPNMIILFIVAVIVGVATFYFGKK